MALLRLALSPSAVWRMRYMNFQAITNARTCYSQTQSRRDAVNCQADISRANLRLIRLSRNAPCGTAPEGALTRCPSAPCQARSIPTVRHRSVVRIAFNSRLISKEDEGARFFCPLGVFDHTVWQTRRLAVSSTYRSVRYSAKRLQCWL